MATVSVQLLTAEEFAGLPNPSDGSRQELVKGEVITMPPPRFDHGWRSFQIAKKLDAYVDARRLGRVVGETGVITERDPDSVRGPDVSFWSFRRLPEGETPEVYPEVAADLCVEVLSRGEAKRMREKLKEYFQCGVRMVWVVDEKKRQITVYREPTKGTLLNWEDTISGDDVIPGFSCQVKELFS